MHAPSLRSLCLSIVAGVCFTQFAHAEDWPRWRGQNANGISSEQVATSWEGGQPKELWSAEVATGFSACVVADGRLVTMGNRDDEDIITCLDANTGELAWTHSYEEPVDPNLFEGGPTATPAIHKGNVYTLSRKGHVCCIELASGKVVWESNIRDQFEANIPAWGFSGSPVVGDAGLLLNVGSHGTLLNPADGKVLWQSDNSDDAGYATPVIIPGSSPAEVLVMSGKAIQSVNVATGEVVWQFPWITRYGVNAADPHLVDGGIFLSSGYSKGTTFIELPVTGPEPSAAWRSRNLRNQMSPGVVIGGHIYATDGDAGTTPTFRCLDVKTGDIAWTHEGLGSATLIAAGETLIILSDDGRLVLAKANAKEFEQLAEAQVLEGKCWTMPTLANGKLYCRNAAGHLVCLKVDGQFSCEIETQ
ncbi:MAG: PQQ-like beta-propeller repeat protein [Planctomycetaceae bacterium]|nr:PQQ-like beta-propeller repeat protein [Planctomycetaceae bacterium]